VHHLALLFLAAVGLGPAAAGVTAPTPATLNTPAATSAPAATTETARETALESALLQGINDVRREHGLRPLATSKALTRAAAEHTREMGERGYFEHESFDSTPFWKRIEHWYPSRGHKSWSVGENLVYSSPQLTASQGVELWMNSPGHRANLLSKSWREIGLAAMHFESAPGEYDDGPVTIVTADFGYRR